MNPRGLKTLSVGQYITLAAVLAVTTVGGYFGYERVRPRDAVAARVSTAEVIQGPIASSVTATGSVATPAQSKLSFRSAGRLTELLVKVGSAVESGQPLARIDDSDLNVSLLQARANLVSAEAKLEQLNAGAKPEDISAAQAQVESARLKLEQTRNVPIGPDMAAAQSQLESAQIKLNQVLAGGRPEDVMAAQAQLDAANARLHQLQNPRPEDLAAAESQLESARIKLHQLLNPRPEDVRTAEAALATATSKLHQLLNPRPEDLAAAQTQLDQAQTKLAQLVDQPRTAKQEDIWNAELSVKNAQVALDKTLSDAGNVGKAGGPSTQAAADASVQQAQINLQTAQNNLSKLQSQGPSDWDLRLQQQAVEAAQVSLNKLKNPSPADRAAAQQSVDQAQAALDKLIKPNDLDRQAVEETVKQAETSLIKLKNPSPADIAAAQQSVTQAQVNLEKLVSPTDFDIQAAQQSVTQAQANLEKLVNNNRYDVQTASLSLVQVQANLDLKKAGPAVYDIAVAQASVEQAKAQLAQAEANLQAATLTAPFAGHVAALGANLGEQVGSGVAAVTLVDTSQVRVDVVVDETDVAKIQPGQQVSLTFEALPGRQVPGTVAVIAPVATVQQGVVNYPVQIEVDPAQAPGIRPGMTATASITTARKDNAVLVPNRALRTQGRNRIVEVMDADGKMATRQVQIGLANEQMTEIMNGLLPGDKVVIPTTGTAAPRVGGVGGFGAPGGIGGPGAVVVRR
jgi:HlyD family secretion protein